MTGNNGIHHLAIATADIKTQIDYFNDVLGLELVALYWMHGVKGAWHGFLRLNDTSSIAFVQTPDVGEIERTIGVTHAGHAGNPCAGGTMQHVALNVDTEADLLAMRDRIRSRGITVVGPIDHGMCQSIYFAGPEDLSLEVSTSSSPIDGRAWIDPDVVERAGISDAELERYRNPVEFVSDDQPVSQPDFDPSKPYPRGYTEDRYRSLVALPDETVLARFSENVAPVTIDDDVS